MFVSGIKSLGTNTRKRRAVVVRRSAIVNEALAACLVDDGLSPLPLLLGPERAAPILRHTNAYTQPRRWGHTTQDALSVYGCMYEFLCVWCRARRLAAGSSHSGRGARHPRCPAQAVLLLRGAAWADSTLCSSAVVHRGLLIGPRPPVLVALLWCFVQHSRVRQARINVVTDATKLGRPVTP